MHRDHQRWYSHRLNRDMGVAIYGNYGSPILAFPTSCGDEWEMEGQGMIGTLSPYLEQGRIRIFCINSVNSDSFQNKGAHPFHRSWMQAQYDAYVANEVFPFIDSQCQTPGIGIATLGASLGAYHAANTLFKHPDHVKRCYALSGIYDMRDSMDGMYDDNFYFNNPVDYMANQSDPWFLHQYASCDIRLVTGCGPWENSGPTYRMSEILRNRGIGHHLDDWGPEGGHEWPYWHHQMWEYVGGHY
jgi:esterase/lipase superfamily enzyme